jgi:hypothetical protein
MKSRFLLNRAGGACFILGLNSGVSADNNNNKLMPGCPIVCVSVEASPMATNDVILLLSDRAEGVGTWNTAPISSRILKTSILVAPAAAMMLAILLVGNPLALFANATASLIGTSSPDDGAARSMPIIGSTAGAQYYLLAPEMERPTRDNIAAAFNTAYQSQTETHQPPAEALIKQFQAWAGEEDARSRAEPVQPAQDAAAQALQNARAQVRPARKYRQVRSVHKGRAQVLPVKNARALVRSKHNARAQVRPNHNAELQVPRVQNAPAHDGSVQNTWIQWAERPFGWLYQN